MTLPVKVKVNVKVNVMENVKIHDKYFKKYILDTEIQQIVRRLAGEISNRFRSLNPLVMPILNGSFIFAADLLREIDFDPQISFVKYSSYEGTQSTGVVKQLIGFPESVKDRHVLLVEDIIESGISMRYTLQQLHTLQPASVSICTFLHKPELFDNSFPIDFIGKSIPNDFIVGYGLDYNGLGRTLKHIYVINS